MEIKKLHNIVQAAPPLFIAHRGESISSPENTIEAVNLAWQRGADGIEIDVHLSKDYEIVVIHDKNTKRTTGVSHLIKNLSLNDIKNINIKVSHNKAIGLIKIPTLIEVLDTVPKGMLAFIEVKCGLEILPRLKKILKATRLENSQIKIISFDLKVISAIKKHLPKYDVLLVKRIGIEKSVLYLDGLSKVISKLKEHNIDGLNLSYSRFLSKNIVEKLRSNNIKLYIWTVNDAKKALRLISIGVDGIVSDRASRLKNHVLEYREYVPDMNLKHNIVFPNSF